MKKLTNIFATITLIVGLITALFYYWHHSQLFPSTDDAYVKAYVVNIAPEVSGSIAKVWVHENQYVTAGTELFSIDDAPFKLAVNKAEAQLEQVKNKIDAAEMDVQTADAKLKQAQAEFINTKLESTRIFVLVKKGYVSKAQADNARKNLSVAESRVHATESQLQQAHSKRGALGENNAELKSAVTALARANLNLSFTHVTAPTSGYISNFDLREGAVVNAYQPQFALVENKTWWVEANFKETDMKRIAIGQTATITLDMYPGRQFHGVVSSLSPNSNNSFSLLPAENATANWVKVTQRFPIRINIIDVPNKNYLLRMGASATVSINTKDPVAT